ncbi:phosphoribosyltransferase domain-containing protein [Psychrobacter sp. I-STPA6b]|uniref:phosphoribosyltransferase domain-containing protein n=1 Tax=Psychrobacter sp. I-STPA6b TaxID=2585718 RepID=UPI001D0C00F7|nr:phosphoribosyltransferase domain-containing protein [Psychrobacter sp. I-STPA6b]
MANTTIHTSTKTITLPRGMLSLTYQQTKETSHLYELDDLLDFAQRINPKRAFLFVSKVLGRHIPVAPSIMRQVFSDLANLIPDNLPEPIVVVGMAETAVGLSAGVHQVLQHRYPNALLLNSTRHAQETNTHSHTDSQTNATLLTTFSEDHSHASQHLIYQSNDPDIQVQLLASKTLIMVDDEASTGNTCINVVNALQQAGLHQLEQVHLTTLVDWSLKQTNINDSISQKLTQSTDIPLQQIERMEQTIAFHRHHLLAGSWQWTDSPNPEPIIMPSLDTTEAGSQPILDTGNWGRFPTLDSTQGFANYLAQFQQAYARHFGIENWQANDWQQNPLPKRILVLGSNEFVWLPFLLAEWLESHVTKQTKNTQNIVKFSALTRSPIALGGAIKHMLRFADNYGLGMTNFVYNINADEWDLIILCIETPADSVDTLWQELDNVLVVSAG